MKSITIRNPCKKHQGQHRLGLKLQPMNQIPRLFDHGRIFDLAQSLSNTKLLCEFRVLDQLQRFVKPSLNLATMIPDHTCKPSITPASLKKAMSVQR